MGTARVMRDAHPDIWILSFQASEKVFQQSKAVKKRWDDPRWVQT